MIERDIQTIKKRQITTRTKTAQALNTLSRRQTSHEKANIKQFQAITNAIGLLPTQEVITKTIQETIKVVVNGKIDHLQSDVTENIKKLDTMKEHLEAQDVVAQTQGNAIKDLTNKINPLDVVKTWLSGLGTVILYVGGVAGAIAAIVGLYYLIHH